jgi:hypothetical protein
MNVMLSGSEASLTRLNQRFFASLRMTNYKCLSELGMIPIRHVEACVMLSGSEASLGNENERSFASAAACAQDDMINLHAE